MADDDAPPQPVWEGPIDEDGKPNGQGKMQYPPPPMADDDEEEKPGDTFEGTMTNGVRQGKGTYTWSNGAIYTGDWVEDVMQGSGTFTYPNGDVYQGEFHAGKRHGKGMYHYKAPCCQLVGDWAEGHFTYGRWIFKDGSMFMGKFAESKPTAGSYYYSTSSLVQEGHFLKDGMWVGHRDPIIGKVSGGEM
ncbi:hypothetical protein Vretifemale_10116 [Volvox reticuliferus]|uniref:Uncharacterized protein n=1 Tax=Volvox reticuliferus TaxID=1737510 RepID=A0A8J4CIR4_9CHLO|nr:hypothetical protein Vretifemale_10116 [Volvox reticuliferus]